MRVRWIAPPSVSRSLRVGALAIGCSAGAACASRPLAVESAPAIRIGAATSSAPRPSLRFYDDFWRALTELDLRMAWVLADSPDERRLADGVEFLLGGEADSAESTVIPLLASRDSLVRAGARLAMDALLSSDGHWERLARFSDSAGLRSGDAAGVEHWAPVFRDVQRRADFLDSVAVLPLERSATGVPVIAVRVNGVVKHLWLDTGSSITILASDVARECGVAPLGHDTLELQTAVGRLPALPTVIRSLRVGGLALESAPAMIVSKELLRVHPGDVTATSNDIAGVIGFDVIRLLDLTIDDADGRVIVRRPRADGGREPRNLGWFGVPIVTLTSEQGVPVHLALDTGSEETFGTRGLVVKSGSGWRQAERRHVRGFGGVSSERGLVVPRVRLFLQRVPLEFRNVFLYAAQYPTLFALDGTLGNDVGRGGVLRIDMTHGRVEVSSH